VARRERQHLGTVNMRDLGNCPERFGDLGIDRELLTKRTADRFVATFLCGIVCKSPIAVGSEPVRHDVHELVQVRCRHDHQRVGAVTTDEQTVDALGLEHVQPERTKQFVAIPLALAIELRPCPFVESTLNLGCLAKTVPRSVEASMQPL